MGWGSVSVGPIGTGQLCFGDEVCELGSHSNPPTVDTAVWKKFVAPSTGTYTVKAKTGTGSGAPTANIYSGTDIVNLSTVTAGTGANGVVSLTFSGTQGTTYYVGITGADLDVGEVEIYITTPSQVATPTASYSNSARTFSCSTSGATIWWRRAGESKWRKYVNPIKILSTVFYEVKATKDGLLVSDTLANG